MSKKYESQTETDLTKALTRCGWFREADAYPGKNSSPWPYFSKGDWRVLIGDLGWVTVYRVPSPGQMEDQESVRTDDLDGIVQLVRRVCP